MIQDFYDWLLMILAIVIPLGTLIALCKFAYWFSEKLFALLGS